MTLTIITEIKDLPDFAELLKNNPGVFIIKFGAVWCGPCKRINGLVHDYIKIMPDNVQCAVIDIDINLEVYGFLKKKRIINGVPTILAYYKDNLHYMPDDMVSGADTVKVTEFFKRCFDQSKET